MREIAQGIREEVRRNKDTMILMDPDGTAAKPAPGKWSKREILGHLIDSAANNHQRFVRAQHGEAAAFPCYLQDEWVAAQHYNERQWMELVELWSAMNLHLAHIVERIPASAANAPVNFNEDRPATLEHVVQDYLRHMRHHLGKIMG